MAKKIDTQGPAEAEQPDQADFYRSLRARVSAWADRNEVEAKYRKYVLAVPDLFHLLCRLALDPRVSNQHKGFLALAVAYVVSPIDLIPSALFGPLGLLDDLIVMVIVLETVLASAPRGVVEEHWAGSQDIYKLIRKVLREADGLVGKGLYRRIRGFLEERGLWPGKGERAAVPPVPEAAQAAGEKPAEKKTAKTAAKKASKKTAKKKTAKKKAAKKAPKKTAATKVAKKKTPARTIGAKKRSRKSPARKTSTSETP